LAQVGRISGPLLQENLIRNGIDLAFRDTLSTNQLLYLDVNNGKIGVDTSTPSNELQVSQTTQTVNLIGDTATTPGYFIDTDTINVFTGNIYLGAKTGVSFGSMENGTIRIKDNTISTITSNANVDITPHGTGTTEIVNDLEVFGDIYTPGNITFEGSITFGDGDATTDTVDFNSDINSDIIPNTTNLHSLGSPSKRWDNIYTNLVNGQAVSTGSLSAGLIDFNLKFGNAFYVSVNGDDTNVGDHPFAPFKTIKGALQSVDASVSGPVTIYVAPGDYEEEFPLVVPPNVSVIGEDLRNVQIRPDTSSQFEDVFHLNGETTIANLTIKNFYFDSNKGYAFRFAPGGVISTRSPYIQNVTVITQGSVTSTSDPKGFDTGDAGHGAYIDGAELDPSSTEASMLFHSCTFITPGVDCITMTNGVRVEWLNSFTYYANRGLYAFNNSTGRVVEDGSTIKYGAEVRSIGSASVYGNYGAYADGADCLMYLIQHNFAYIGVGKDSSNDETLAIQSQEVVELNSGQIHYVSTDHTGAFRVGDNFFVDFETGESSFNVEDVTAAGFTNVIISDGADETVLDINQVRTGNIRFTENRIDALLGDLNVEAASNEINLLTNVDIANDLDITGNLSFDGTLNLLGNQTTDTLKFNVDFDQDINPNTDSSFDLGSSLKQWKNVWLSQSNIGDTRIFDNIVTTDVSNANLELRSNGTSVIYVPSNNVTFSQNLTVSTDTSLQDTSITTSLTHTGNYNQTGRYIIGGEFTVDNVYVEDNFISTTTGNLILEASGTGELWIPNNNVQINNNLTVSTDTDLQGTTITGTLTQTGNKTQVGSYTQTGNLTVNGPVTISSKTQFEDIKIDGNLITTTQTNSDLELRAAGTGKVQFSENVQVENNFYVRDVLTGNININQDLVLDEISITDSVIQINDNFITTKVSNADLELRANGIGTVIVPSNDVVLGQDLTVNTDTDIDNTVIVGNIVHAGDTTQTGNIALDGDLTVGSLTLQSAIQFEDIKIAGNVLTTTLSNSNLDLRAAGTGDILIPNNDVNISNDVFVGSLNVSAITIDDSVSLEILEASTDVQFFDNVITTTNSNSNLELRGVGTGSIYLQSLEISENSLGTRASPDSTLSTITFTPGDRFIVQSNGSIILPKGINAERKNGQGDLRFNTATNFFEGYNGTSNVVMPGIYSDDRKTSATVHPTDNTINFTINNIDVGSIDTEKLSIHGLEVDDISIQDNVIRTTNTNSDLQLRAQGGSSLVMNTISILNDTITNNTNGALEIRTTNYGVSDFANANTNTYGVVIPSGDNSERPASPETGMTRWNGEVEYMEVWDGSGWIIASGEQDIISPEEFEDLLLQYTLIYG